jgi:hypothetical protein
MCGTIPRTTFATFMVVLLMVVLFMEVLLMEAPVMALWFIALWFREVLRRSDAPVMPVTPQTITETPRLAPAARPCRALIFLSLASTLFQKSPGCKKIPPHLRSTRRRFCRENRRQSRFAHYFKEDDPAPRNKGGHRRCCGPLSAQRRTEYSMRIVYVRSCAMLPPLLFSTRQAPFFSATAS